LLGRAGPTAVLVRLNSTVDAATGEVNALLAAANYDQVFPLYEGVKGLLCCTLPDSFSGMWTALTIGGILAWWAHARTRARRGFKAPPCCLKGPALQLRSALAVVLQPASAPVFSPSARHPPRAQVPRAADVLPHRQVRRAPPHRLLRLQLPYRERRP
jgi:hypothetical protein